MVTRFLILFTVFFLSMLTVSFPSSVLGAIPPESIDSDRIIDDLVIGNRDLIIEKGVTVTIKGTLSIKGYSGLSNCGLMPCPTGPSDGRLINFGTLNNEGLIMIFSNAGFINYGTVNNLETMEVTCNAAFSNEGKILGKEIIVCDEPYLENSCGTETFEDENGQCVPIQEDIVYPDEDESGGGCLIATATYGSELAPQVQQLREIRDNLLLQTESGTSFMSIFNDVYYSFSPYIADYERENLIFKEGIRLFITPMLSTLSIMTLVEEGSESQILGLGISIIMLNLGMYFVAPVLIIIKIGKKFKC